MPSARQKPKQTDDVDEVDEVDEAPVYRYEYVGTQPTVFPSLTGLGIGEVWPGEALELPDPIVHAELVPADKATSDATAELVEWVATLEAEANGLAPQADVVDDGPAAETELEQHSEVPVADAGTDIPPASPGTDPDPGAGDDATPAEEH